MSRSGCTAALLVAALALVMPASPAAATVAEYTIDPAHSVFAVLTHKVGIGSSLAHDHLVVAEKPAVKLEFDPDSPAALKVAFAVAVATLEVDAPGPRAAWKGRFKELGIHSGELPLVPDADRQKVRVAMLGESQLAATMFPEIRAEVFGLEPNKSAGPRVVPPWIVLARLTIRGKTIERRLPATWSEQNGTLSAEIVGELHFRDFGIEPYSTFLGAIRNDDLFHLFVSVVARRAP